MRVAILLAFVLASMPVCASDDKGIPDVLQPWKDWILYKAGEDE